MKNNNNNKKKHSKFRSTKKRYSHFPAELNYRQLIGADAFKNK